MIFELTVGEYIVYISIIYGRGFLYPVWEKYQSIRVKLKYQSMIQTVMVPTVTCVVGFLKHKSRESVSVIVQYTYKHLGIVKY